MFFLTFFIILNPALFATMFTSSLILQVCCCTPNCGFEGKETCGRSVAVHGRYCAEVLGTKCEFAYKDDSINSLF